MANNNICLSCHLEHESQMAFCEICLPWSVKNKDSNLEPLPKLSKLSVIDYFHNPKFSRISKFNRPESECEWADLICEIYDCLDDSDFHPYIEQLLDSIDEILDYIARLNEHIQIEIERFSANESLASSYYDNFYDLNRNQFTGKSKFEIKIQDYKIEFEIVSTRQEDLSAEHCTSFLQTEFSSIYSLRVSKINGTEVSFQRNQILACAEFISLHDKGEQDFNSCIEEIKKRRPGTPPLNIKFSGQMPESLFLKQEVDEIINGNRGVMAKDLLLCTLYKFEHLEISEELLDLNRTRSFQFLRGIVLELKDKVTPIPDGLLVESVCGNCYQIQMATFMSELSFWSVFEIYTNEFICIELKDMKGPRLPEGDYLATIVLSLYDDYESSNLIHTLAS